MRNFMQNLHDGLPIPPPGVEKETEAPTDTELLSTEDIQPLAVQDPPHDSNIRQLIREECSINVCEEQKQNMEKKMLELVEICHHKQFLCMHDNVDDLIESALDYKLLLINLINSQHLGKMEQEVKNIEEQPAEHRNHAKKSLQNFRVIHKSSISLKHTSQISSVHVVAPILSTKERENSLSMGDDESVKDIEYVDASLPDPKITSVEEENVVHQEEEEIDLEDIQDIVLREKLFSINHLIANIESLKDKPTPVCVFNSSTSISIFEESDESLLDNFSPEFETFCDHTEETRSGNTTTHANYSIPEYDSFHFKIEPDQEKLFSAAMKDISDNSSNDSLLEEVYLFLTTDHSIPPGIENFYDPEGDIHFLEALLINDFIPFSVNESFDFENDPSIPRPPSKPPDEETNPEVISAVMENINEPNESFNPGGEIFVSTNDEDIDYFPFMFFIRIFLPYLIHPEISPLFLSTESEDTVFDPGISDLNQWYLVGMELLRIFICLSKFC
nr:hypothetical protein [Tanacetum cinerariifolium]